MRRLLLVPLLLLVASGCGPGPTAPVAKTNPDRGIWRKLSRGMSQERVRAVLGEPLRVENQGDLTCWYYQEGEPLHQDAQNARTWVIPRGSLLFSGKAGGGCRLTQWREP